MKPAVQNSDLAALADEAAAADAGNLPGESTAAPGNTGSYPAGAAVPDPAAEWAQFPALFGAIVGQAMPELVPVYSDAACRKWGEAMVPLAERYGWSAGKFMEKFGPWLGVCMATWPLAVPTVQAIRARRAPKPSDDATPDKPAAPSNIVAMPTNAGDDPELRDPTLANRPPRPVQ